MGSNKGGAFLFLLGVDELTSSPFKTPGGKKNEGEFPFLSRKKCFSTKVF